MSKYKKTSKGVVVSKPKDNTTPSDLWKKRHVLKQDFKQSEKVDKRILSRFDETTVSTN